MLELAAHGLDERFIVVDNLKIPHLLDTAIEPVPGGILYKAPNSHDHVLVSSPSVDVIREEVSYDLGQQRVGRLAVFGTIEHWRFCKLGSHWFVCRYIGVPSSPSDP